MILAKKIFLNSFFSKLFSIEALNIEISFLHIIQEMKSLLYTAVEQSPSGDVIDPEILTRYFAKFDEQFFHFCDNELAKINTFYSEKLAESTRKFANLRSELAEAQVEAMPEKEKARFRKPLIARRKDHPVRKAQELKLAFSEFYLSLVLLQNYQNLNFTGFRKILKKHDKLLTVDFGARWRQEHVEQSHFYTNKDIDRLINETESIVTEIEGGNRTKAMKRLRVPPLGEHQSAWTTFKVGLFSGAFFILIVAVILSALFYSHKTDNFKVAVRIYRAPFLLILFLFFWSINVYGWRSSGVNHVLIFEIDPRNHLSEQHIMELSAVFGVVWSLSVLSYLYSDVLGVPAYVNPLIMYVVFLAFLFNPTKTMQHEARFWSIR